MAIPGHVAGGVVVLEGDVRLPEGTPVSVVSCATPVLHVAKRQKRVVLPLAPSKRPGSVNLTGERIAEILLEQEVSP